MKRSPLLYWFFGPRSISLCNFCFQICLHYINVYSLPPLECQWTFIWLLLTLSPPSLSHHANLILPKWFKFQLQRILLVEPTQLYATRIKMVKKFITCRSKACKVEENSLSHPWWWVLPASPLLLASSFLTFLLTWEPTMKTAATLPHSP